MKTNHGCLPLALLIFIAIPLIISQLYVHEYTQTIEITGSHIQTNYAALAVPAITMTQNKLALNNNLSSVGTIKPPVNFNMTITDADGNNVIKISDNGSYPSWSPDGEKIVFDSKRDGNTDIYVMDTNGNNVKRLTTDPAYDRDPCWSPDGEKIVFVSNRDGNDEIYVMNADGTNQINITNNPAEDRDPAWCCQPLKEPASPPLSEEPSQTQPPAEEISPIGFLAIFIIPVALILSIFFYRKIILRN